tara:strand:+ start:18 stop:557 length:540 start_codon:yes stop_codon:yes gene_type:complete
MKDIHIKDALLHVLRNMSDSPFTVAQLTQKYLKHPECQHADKKSARQYVYRKMVRMITLDHMMKLSDNTGWPRYQLTSRFLHATVNLEATSNEVQNTAVTKQPISPVLPLEHALKEKLSRYRSDMLCALGESEEYSAICNEHPDLCKNAQALYNEARERSAMLLGKMKALENMLSHSAG